MNFVRFSTLNIRSCCCVYHYKHFQKQISNTIFIRSLYLDDLISITIFFYDNNMLIKNILTNSKFKGEYKTKTILTLKMFLFKVSIFSMSM